MTSFPTAWSGRCSPGGATIVRQLPVARAWASATWPRPWSSDRGRRRSVPTTWNAKSLSIRIRTPSPAGVVQLAQPKRRSSTGSAARANRSRWNCPIDHRRHPPAGDGILAELEEAGRHVLAPQPGSPTKRRVDGLASASSEGPRRRSGDRRRSIGGASRIAELAAIDVDTTPGIPHASMRSKSARSTVTLRAMPWYVTPRSTRRPSAPILRGRAAVRVAPAAGMAVARAGVDAEGGTGRHERRLERAHERADEQAALVERDDRIGHELAGTVVGHLAATLDADDLDAAGVELVGGRQDVGRVAVAPERQDGGMLEEQEPVADPSVGPLGGQPSLDDVRVRGTRCARATRPGSGSGAAGSEDGRIHARTIAGQAAAGLSDGQEPVRSPRRSRARRRRRDPSRGCSRRWTSRRGRARSRPGRAAR